MLWRVAGLSTTSPVESVLDKDVYTLEELLDEDEILQECKALNSRLINFLRGKRQVLALLRYVIEEPPDIAENKRAFKFPFIACEIFTCEIDVMFKTLVEDDELMCFLFSFLEPGRPHGTLLAGYFSKVVICLLLRKTIPVMRYLQAHQEILRKLVDLIGITSIMEVLIRLVGADEHIYAFHVDALQWLAGTNLLDLLVDKLSPPHSSEVHANAAETLSAVTRIAPSALASKLSSPRFVGRLFHHVLEDPESKSTLVHSLSVCISLLDPKRAATVAAARAARGQHVAEPVPTPNPETVEGMLQRLGDLLRLLDVATDDKVLPTTYGELRPPLGIHRLKVVEFIAVLLQANSEGARQELVRSGAIQLVLQLFFNYPFNNMLHHHVESIVTSCLESNNQALLDHLFEDCEFIARLLAADDNPYAPDTRTEPRPPTSRAPLRIGNMGHVTHLANKVVQAAATNCVIQNHLQVNPSWSEWQSTVLQKRNMLENVFQWTCGRPTAVQDRPVDSDEDNFRDRDYDISTMASNLTRYRYGMFDNEDAEGQSAVERDEEDVFFDDESAEVVISSLQLGDEQDSSERLKDSMYAANSNWFAFQDDSDRTKPQNSPMFLMSSPLNYKEDGQATEAVSSPNSSMSDDVVVGEDDDLVDTATSSSHLSPLKLASEHQFENGVEHSMVVPVEKGEQPLTCTVEEEPASEVNKAKLSDNLSLSCQSGEQKSHSSASKSLPEEVIVLRGTPWALEGTSDSGLFGDKNPFEVHFSESMEPAWNTPTPSTEGVSRVSANAEALCTELTPSPAASSKANICHDSIANDRHISNPLFGAREIIGVEPGGTAKAMEKMLKEGVVGEAGPMLAHDMELQNEVEPTSHDNATGDPDFNDVNYWRSDYEQSVVKDDQS